MQHYIINSFESKVAENNNFKINRNSYNNIKRAIYHVRRGVDICDTYYTFGMDYCDLVQIVALPLCKSLQYQNRLPSSLVLQWMIALELHIGVSPGE